MIPHDTSCSESPWQEVQIDIQLIRFHVVLIIDCHHAEHIAAQLNVLKQNSAKKIIRKDLPNVIHSSGIAEDGIFPAGYQAPLESG